MLARRTLGRIASQPTALGAAPSQARNMATLREIELRLKSVRNIEKITKVCFPLVNAAKYPITLFYPTVHENDCFDKTREGAARYAGRQGLRTCQQRCVLLCFYLKYNPDGPILSLAEIFSHAASEETGKRKLFVVISSDKGLCGGIHSSVSKATRREFAEKDKVEADSPIMVIGDKSKAQLSRALPKNLALTFNQIGRDIPTFADAAGVADLILTSGAKYDTIAIVYNRFVSAISYEPTIVEIEPETLLKESGKLLIEDVE